MEQRPVSIADSQMAYVRSEDGRKELEIKCLSSFDQAEGLATLAAPLGSSPEEARAAFCTRFVGSVVTGTINGVDFQRVAQGDAERTLEIAVELLKQPDDPGKPSGAGRLPTNPTAFPPSATSADEQSAKSFFSSYIALQDAYDPSFSDWFADDAVVALFSRDKDGILLQSALTGRKAREFTYQLAPIARRAGLRDIFTNINIAIAGKRARIDADRQSKGGCYIDREWFMVIEAQPDRTYRIVELQETSDTDALCD